MSKAISFSVRDQKQLGAGIAFVSSVVAAALLLYLIPADYSYNHSGLSLVVTVIAIVLIIKVRSRNHKTKSLRLGGLANMAGASALVDLVGAVYVTFVAVKSLLASALGGSAPSLFSHITFKDPVLPLVLLSGLLIFYNTDNSEAKKVADWSNSLVVVAVLLGLLYEFLAYAPTFLLK